MKQIVTKQTTNTNIENTSSLHKKNIRLQECNTECLKLVLKLEATESLYDEAKKRECRESFCNYNFVTQTRFTVQVHIHNIQINQLFTTTLKHF